MLYISLPPYQFLRQAPAAMLRKGAGPLAFEVVGQEDDDEMLVLPPQGGDAEEDNPGDEHLDDLVEPAEGGHRDEADDIYCVYLSWLYFLILSA